MLKLSSLTTVIACACTLSTFTPAHAESPEVDGSVNAMCPIGKEPIVPSAGTVDYKGKQIGLCCPGCGKQFLAWDESRKDDFVALAVAQREPGQEHGDNAKPRTADLGVDGPTYPYPLPDCPVGGPLGSMGEPIVNVYENREVRFCCAGCVGKFEEKQATYWDEIDKNIIAQQQNQYPIDTCIVTGKVLGDDAVNHVHNNRLVRLANAEAAAAFKSNPTKHLAALDKKIIETQLPTYPMDSCPVGGPLGSMGDPVNYIYMNQLVRFCCEGCRPAFEADPQKYLSKLSQK